MAKLALATAAFAMGAVDFDWFATRTDETAFAVRTDGSTWLTSGALAVRPGQPRS